MKIIGRLYVHEVDESTGRRRLVSVQDNVITTVGKVALARRLSGNADNVFTHMAIGTGNAAAAETQTALGTEIVRGSANVTVSGNIVTVTYAVPRASGSGQTFREAGVFNASTAGTMINRVVLATPYMKTGNNLPIFTFTFTVA